MWTTKDNEETLLPLLALIVLIIQTIISFQTYKLIEKGGND